jgi:hypothetical protein
LTTRRWSPWFARRPSDDRPQAHRAFDGGFPAHEQIDAVHEQTQGKTEVIAPVPEPRRKPGDDDAAPPDKHQR